MRSGNSPPVVIVIPCAAVDGLARRCLQHCLRLEYDPFEIVLLPDHLPTMPLPADPRLRVLPTGPATIAAKRNLGMRAYPDHELYAFIDSDAYPDPGWLREVGAAFARASADVWLVGGPNISPPDQALSAQVVGSAMRSVILSGTGAFRKRRSASRFCGHLPACNLVGRADALRCLRGFDESLLTGEDIDLCARASAAGGRIYFESAAVVLHQDRELLLPFLRQRFVYGCSVWKLIARDPSPRKAYLLLPFLFLSGLFLGPFFFAHPLAQVTYFTALGLFFSLALVESLRHGRVRFSAVTVLVHFLGAIAPGVGSAFVLARLPVDVGTIYRKSRNLA